MAGDSYIRFQSKPHLLSMYIGSRFIFVNIKLARGLYIKYKPSASSYMDFLYEIIWIIMQTTKNFTKSMESTCALTKAWKCLSVVTQHQVKPLVVSLYLVV